MGPLSKNKPQPKLRQNQDQFRKPDHVERLAFSLMNIAKAHRISTSHPGEYCEEKGTEMSH